MKVHVISPILSRFGGGVFTVVKELYGYKSSLTKNNITFFLWGYKDDFCEEDCKPIEAKKFFIPLKGLPLNKIYFSATFKNKFKNEINSNDIVHLHSLWQYPSLLLNQVIKQEKFLKIISPHGMLDSWALNNNRIQKKISLFLYEKRNLQTADCIHALCEKEYQDIKKLAPRVPIAIIPNGIHLPEESLYNRDKDDTIKKMLFLGRIHPKKGLENLIKGWVENENWKLVIAGVDENGYENYLKEIVLKLNKKNIEFVGPVFGKQKEKLLISSNAFILPSLSEGLPMSILEAWSYKLPVLMTPECNLEKGFDCKAAIEIDSSIDGIATGINKMFDMEDQNLVKMGLLGYELVKSEYTWDKVSAKMENLYLWLVNKSEKPDFVKL